MKQIVLCIASLLICGISFAQSVTISKSHWLIGKWENQTSRGKMIEDWSFINDSTLGANSYMITATDSTSLESVRLVKEDQAIYYIPTVKGQNNDLPVKFKLTSVSASEMVFENPDHDFPQKITYTLISENSLLAEISGIVNGQMRSRKFPMTRASR
jgi:hypothetical protein